MARTKQTAQKNTGGKPLAMGRGKATPKKNPTPGGRADREVVQGYKYRYPGGVSMKVPFVPTKSEEGEEAPATSETATTSDPTTT